MIVEYRCSNCNRPLLASSDDGLGPVCRRALRDAIPPPYEGDLLGFDLDRAQAVAEDRLEKQLELSVAATIGAVRAGFRALRQGIAA